MVLPVIVASILDAAPLGLRFTFSVIFQESQPYRSVDITEAWNRRSLRLFVKTKQMRKRKTAESIAAVYPIEFEKNRRSLMSFVIVVQLESSDGLVHGAIWGIGEM